MTLADLESKQMVRRMRRGSAAGLPSGGGRISPDEIGTSGGGGMNGRFMGGPGMNGGGGRNGTAGSTFSGDPGDSM